jgi:hypothetical protein
MKKTAVLILVLAAISITIANACEINVGIDGAKKKEVYKAGDEIVVLVHVKHVHKVCKLDIESTTYEPSGLKIMAATDWKEVTPGVFERKMKLKVTGTSTGKVGFVVRRKCSKENNTGSIALNSTPV